MTRDPLNDNDPVVNGSGQAALLLSESLLHSLISRKILSASDAIEIVGTAVDIQRDTLAESNIQNPAMEHALRLLSAMQRSLDTDLILD